MYQGQQAVREGFESYLAGLLNNIEFGTPEERAKALDSLRELGQNPAYKKGVNAVIRLLTLPEGEVKLSDLVSRVILEFQKMSSIHVGDSERLAAVNSELNDLYCDSLMNVDRFVSTAPVVDYHKADGKYEDNEILLKILKKPGSPN